MYSLLSVTLKHDFFDQQSWNEASLVPDPQTSQLMQRYQWQVVQKGNSWLILSYSSTPRDSFVTNLKNQLQDTPLRFWLCQPQQSFAVFTDVPLNWCGLMAFNSHDIDDNTNKEGTPDSLAPLRWQDSPLQKCPEGTFGFFDAYPADLFASDAFLIHLKCRKTQWQFRFIQQSQSKLSQPEIVSEDPEQVFSTPKPYVTEEGQSAWLSDSGNTLLPLQQTPLVRLKLVDHKLVDTRQQKRITRTVISALPTPNTGLLYKSESVDSQASSRMYVYV